MAEFEAANCTFVGEGRANVVFSLTNQDGNPTFQGTHLLIKFKNFGDEVPLD